ncbi:MAG: hypothetical protein RL449_117 [Bacteroidota bacterium]|jgi:hypothetical protein
MKLIKKLSANEIRTGFISLSKNLLGTFYPNFTLADIENAPNHKIRIDQTFHVPQLGEEIFNKRLELRIQSRTGGIVVELILNNIMQRLNLLDTDLLIIEQIEVNDYQLAYIRETDHVNYGRVFDSLNGQRFLVIQDNEGAQPIAHVEIENTINEDADEEDLSKDTSNRLEELMSIASPEIKERISKYRQRNKSIVNNLKELYQGKCQITGTQFTFKKKNGELYSEVHHLIPLGENGSDSYANAIVISPLVHRMLHFADVSEIDLSKIHNHKLPISINGQPYEITWHPEHSSTVEESFNR